LKPKSKTFLTKIDFTSGLDYVDLRPFFLEIRLIACSIVSKKKLEVLKALSFCGFYKKIFFKVNLFCLAIPLYVDFPYLVVFFCVFKEI
jgi:hypothetical protein